MTVTFPCLIVAGCNIKSVDASSKIFYRREVIIKGVDWWKGKLSLTGGDEQEKVGGLLGSTRKVWCLEFVITSLQSCMKKPAFI